MLHEFALKTAQKWKVCFPTHELTVQVVSKPLGTSSDVSETEPDSEPGLRL